MDELMRMLAAIVPIAIGLVVALLVLVTGYVKASPDTAYIFSGLRRQPKVLTGKAGLRSPFLEKKDELNLQQMASDRQKFATLVKENAEPLAKVDKITMYGNGNSSKLVEGSGENKGE